MTKKLKIKYASKSGTFSRNVDQAGSRVAWFYAGELCCDSAVTPENVNARFHIKEALLQDVLVRSRELRTQGYA